MARDDVRGARSVVRHLLTASTGSEPGAMCPARTRETARVGSMRVHAPRAGGRGGATPLNRSMDGSPLVAAPVVLKCVGAIYLSQSRAVIKQRAVCALLPTYNDVHGDYSLVDTDTGIHMHTAPLISGEMAAFVPMLVGLLGAFLCACVVVGVVLALRMQF